MIKAGLWGVVFMTMGVAQAASTAGATVAWRDWQEGQFQTARDSQKLILLDLEAVWCHWCHVMNQTTYRDPSVTALLNRHYLAVKVDHDARPDLAERYREWGWPATIVFDAQGRELFKRAGYIAPGEMAALLQRLLQNPEPIDEQTEKGPKQFSTSALLDNDTRQALLTRFITSHDTQLGGLDLGQKFLDRDTVEYALLMTLRGDQQAEAIARADLDAALALIDPVWGGVYQYSTHGDWQHPHYEKLGFIQAEYLRAYALGYLVLREPRYLDAASAIRRYMNTFLRSEQGIYYVSQDADLNQGTKAHDYFQLDNKARRARGMPRIDKNQYSKENALMAEALAMLYSATGETLYLKEARQAYHWILKQRRLAGGGVAHSQRDTAGPYLADNLAMLRAALALYTVSGERQDLNVAREVANFIEQHLRHPARPGYMSAAARGVLAPTSSLDENIHLARVLIRLHHYSGEAKFKRMAEHALRYLVTPEIALSRLTEAGILLAEIELSNDPTHLTIVGRKDHPQAAALFKAALAYPSVFRRIEWWDGREGAMPNDDVRYPQLDRPAAFVCTDGRCSLPVFEAEALTRTADSLTGRASDDTVQQHSRRKTAK